MHLVHQIGVEGHADAEAAEELLDIYKKALKRLRYDYLRCQLLKYPKAAFDYSIRF